VIDPQKLSREVDQLAKNFRGITKRMESAQLDLYNAAVRARAAELDLPFGPALEMARLGNSLSQGARSSAGFLFQTFVVEELKAVVYEHAIQTQFRLPGHRMKPIDIRVHTPRRLYFLSLKTSTRERALNAWRTEFNDIEEFCDESSTPFRFIPLTADPVNQGLRAQLEARIEYMSIQDHDSIVRLLKDIWKDSR